MTRPDLHRASHLAARLGASLSLRPASVADRDPPYHEAAVALVLHPVGTDDAEILVIRRAVREGDPWSGQVALPGGRSEEDDESLESTAIRETFEEVGVDLRSGARALGALDELRPRTPVLPPVIVRPFLFIVPDLPTLTPSDEVAEARWIPLGRLFEPVSRVRASVEVRGATLHVDAYQVDDLTIWGMTERILTTFEGHWR